MRMPFLSNMVSARRVITHSDEDGQYVVTLKPNVGLVAAFGLTLLPARPLEYYKIERSLHAT